ncbi:SDR family oxidoreductase [Candidatus Roizmanbacteria bacterium]|nr:SDR family oxidoreductase [Candidatus Roizmanbacteria bacterium]
MIVETLNGKVAVIVGASSGLGRALAQLLSTEGVKVFALARSIESSNLASSIIKIPLNIHDFKQIDEAFSAIDKQTNKIDILINCAGRGLVKNLEDTTRDEIIDVLGINLNGNLYIAQEVYKRMIHHNSGHIINVISTSGVKARADETIYCASKWGLRGFTESLRLAAAPHKIRVTGIYPGGMDTNFWKIGKFRDTSQYMKAEDVAHQIIMVLKSPTTIAPSEYIIERGF